MTSLEIAGLTDKRHNHVLRDIRAMLSQVHDLGDNPDLDNPDLRACPDLSYEGIQGVTIHLDERTKRVSRIDLDKDHTLTLLTGYDAKARFKVVQRWQELEGASSALALSSVIPQALEALGERLKAIEGRMDWGPWPMTRPEHRPYLHRTESERLQMSIPVWFLAVAGGVTVPEKDARAVHSALVRECHDLDLDMGRDPYLPEGLDRTFPRYLLDQYLSGMVGAPGARKDPVLWRR